MVLVFVAINTKIINQNNLFVHHFGKIKANGIIKYYEKSEHYKHYRTAKEMFKKNFFFGVGVKKFRKDSYNPEYNPKEGANGGTVHPHQIHFEFLSEIGIVGYFLLFGFFVYQFFLGFYFYLKNKNIFVLASTLFLFAAFLPILPSGSFFTTYTATIFWINYSVILKNKII